MLPRESRQHHVQRTRYISSAHRPRAPGASGSVSLAWLATARMTLPTRDRAHLGRCKVFPIGTELEVRIHFAPATSLEQTGSALFLGLGLARRGSCVSRRAAAALARAFSEMQAPTGPGGVERELMPDDFEPARHVIEGLADLVGDLAQCAAATGTAAWRGVAQILSRQVRRQLAARRLLTLKTALWQVTLRCGIRVHDGRPYHPQTQGSATKFAVTRRQKGAGPRALCILGISRKIL